jgi:hypothetical protein
MVYNIEPMTVQLFIPIASILDVTIRFIKSCQKLLNVIYDRPLLVHNSFN